MRLRHTAFGVLLGLLPWAVSAHAQSVPPGNDDCLACHGEPSMTRADGRPVVVDPARFGQSVHAPLACVDCHADLATVSEFPHPDRLAPVNCATCHDEPAMQLAGSVHAKVPAAAGGALKCVDCHGPPHQMRPGSDPQSPTHKLAIAGTCGQCHGTPGSGPSTSQRRGIQVASMFADSIHGRALSRSGLIVAPTCSDCHRSHDVQPKTSAQSPVHAQNVPATCGKCHEGIQHEYASSIHGTELQKGSGQAPECASCHTAHSIRGMQTDASQLSAVEQCGTCHKEALATYRDTFHGQVTRLGFTPVAKCVNCHTSHRILPASNPMSSVAPANRLATCQQCHKDANLNFAQYEPHANKHDRERLPALYYAGRFMDTLLVGVFAFFGIHSALWFVRERTAGPSGGEEPRG